jgi:hypothetical protein
MSEELLASQKGIYLRSSVFFDVTQLWLVVIDVSGQSIGIVFKCQAIQEDSHTEIYSMQLDR